MSFTEFFNTLRESGFLYKLISDPNLLFTVGIIITVVTSYLLGSLNFAIMISKKEYHQDIRTHGSGNAGMTNMMRTYGKRAAIFTLAGDALKAIVAGLIGYAALGQLGAYISGVFCVLGHMYPIFYKFKGGKGVATTAASMLVCNPYVFIIELVLYVVIVAIWKYISLASIMCALLYPLVLNGLDTVLLGRPSPYGIFTVVIAVLVTFKHKDNIKRLLDRSENKFSFKKSVKKDDLDDK